MKTLNAIIGMSITLTLGVCCMWLAALLCDDCGKAIQLAIQTDVGPDWKNTLRVDSDQYPQGPYSDGGGEADCPQHCDSCRVFLENPLTDDGREYVRQEIESNKRARESTVVMWAEFYGDSL